MHGGWSPDCKTIDSVRELPRVQEIPENGLASDLIWSDPDQITGYKESARGAGYIFGEVNIILSLGCYVKIQQGKWT